MGSEGHLACYHISDTTRTPVTPRKSAAQGLAQYRIPVSQITAFGSIWRKTS